MAFIYVVIPVFNASEFLNSAVCSILNQPYKDIKIILVDDGSTDGSSKICDELEKYEERITAIHQKNCGVSVARNRGIEYILENVKCECYVAFLDADDFWCKNSITDSKIEEIKLNNPDIVGFSAYISNSKGTKVRNLGRYDNEIVEFSDKYQTQELWFNTHFASHFYHIRLFSEESIKFDPKCKKNEDIIFAAEILFCSKKIMNFNDYLYVYRRNSMSVTCVSKYTLSNEAHIPDAWYRANTQFDSYRNISEQAKTKWKKFCLSVSSMRCLEMMRCLAQEGYSTSEINKCFEGKEYYENIRKLPESSMADWQKSDLIRYKEGVEVFCAFYRKKAGYSRIKQKLASIKLIYTIAEKIKYMCTRDVRNKV